MALCQRQRDELCLIEFASKRLQPAQRRWDTREREAFAIKWSIDRFRDYVCASHFFVLSDHQSLRWMESSENSKIQRWTLFLQQYDFTLLYIKGEDNYIADWLSRSLEDDSEADSIIDIVAIPACPIQQIEPVSAKFPLPLPSMPTVDSIISGYSSMTNLEKRDTILCDDKL